eukprot:4592307-Amphidinium_carterae.1
MSASSQSKACASINPEPTLAQLAARRVIKEERSPTPPPEVIMIVDPDFVRTWKRIVLWVCWAYRQGAAQAVLASWNHERQTLHDVQVQVQPNRLAISRAEIILRPPLKNGNPGGLRNGPQVSSNTRPVSTSGRFPLQRKCKGALVFMVDLRGPLASQCDGVSSGHLTIGLLATPLSHARPNLWLDSHLPSSAMQLAIAVGRQWKHTHTRSRR